MKIGILTFHRSINYGAFMQCYSLSQRLMRDFPQHTIEVIDYNSGIIQDYYDKQIETSDPATAEKLSQRAEAFRQVLSHLPLSRRQLVGDSCEEVAQWLNEEYDAVIVGSDAVWNWIIRGFPNPYFLKDYKGLKLSYAASAHGQRFRTMTTEQKAYLKEAFGEFYYLGVRDSNTEEMVRFADPNLCCRHNCDPTVFLELDKIPCDMDALKDKLRKRGVDFSKPLIGIMGYPNKIGRELKHRLGKEVQLVALYEENHWADVFLYDLTPFEWARVFSLFTATVTHFFHGTLLSLVNGTPVFSVESAGPFALEYTTKIQDVLGRMDLSQQRFLASGGVGSLPKRVWNKLGLPVDTHLWKEVCTGIREIIEGKDLGILPRVQEEAKAYEDFRNALEQGLKTYNRTK